MVLPARRMFEDVGERFRRYPRPSFNSPWGFAPEEDLAVPVLAELPQPGPQSGNDIAVDIAQRINTLAANC